MVPILLCGKSIPLFIDGKIEAGSSESPTAVEVKVCDPSYAVFLLNLEFNFRYFHMDSLILACLLLHCNLPPRGTWVTPDSVECLAPQGRTGCA